MTEQATNEVLARHVSPDGQLTLLVVRAIEPPRPATIIVGFEESPWHVHVDAFDPAGRSWEQVGHDLAADIVNDRMLIVIVRGGDYPDIRLADNLEDEVDYLPNGERPELRFWSGRRTSFDELIDGTVTYTPL